MAKVEFVGDEIVSEVEEGSKLVDVAKESGSSLPFGCTNGVCGTCICKVVGGKENLSEMQPVPERQTLEMFGALDGEHRLACQCIVNGDVQLDNP